MAKITTTYVDEVSTNPNMYEVKDVNTNELSLVTLTRQAHVITAGTPLNAQHMNEIVNSINDLYDNAPGAVHSYSLMLELGNSSSTYNAKIIIPFLSRETSIVFLNANEIMTFLNGYMGQEKYSNSSGIIKISNIEYNIWGIESEVDGRINILYGYDYSKRKEITKEYISNWTCSRLF